MYMLQLRRVFPLSTCSQTSDLVETSSRSSAPAATVSRDETEIRGKIIALLEQALTLADELNDRKTGYLVERALDEARSQRFRVSSFF